jgi:hypothetical protein
MSTATSPFAMKTKSAGSGEDWELPPGGTHAAVLVALIDLGTHSFEFKGKPKESRKIYYVWELTAENDSKGNSFTVARDFTWSMSAKSHQRPMIEAWVGTIADDQEFDPTVLLGKPCFIGLTEGTSSNDKKFIEVATVGQPMKGFAVPPASKPLFTFHLSQVRTQKDSIPIPEWVPRLYGREIIDEIKSSKEFLALPVTTNGNGDIPY